MTGAAGRCRVGRDVGVFLSITGAVAVPLWLLQPRAVEVAAALPVASLAPLLGAVVVMVLRGNRIFSGWRGLLGWRPVRRMVLAAGVGLGIVLGIVQLRTLLDWDLVGLTMIALPVPLAVVAVITLLAVTGQEAGWRGVLQPTLASRFGEPGAAVGTGLAWAAWSAPGLVVLGFWQLALLAISAIALSLVIGRLQRDLPVAGGLAVAVAFRWVLTMGLLVSNADEPGVLNGLVLLAGVSTAAAILAYVMPRILQFADRAAAAALH